MDRRNCPCQSQGRTPRFAQPVPLYDRVAPPSPEAAAPPAAAPVRPAARSRLEEAEMRIRRYTNPIPAAATAAECETLALLRQQNALLTEILAALNTQLAVNLDHLRK